MVLSFNKSQWEEFKSELEERLLIERETTNRQQLSDKHSSLMSHEWYEVNPVEVYFSIALSIFNTIGVLGCLFCLLVFCQKHMLTQRFNW